MKLKLDAYQFLSIIYIHFCIFLIDFTKAQTNGCTNEAINYDDVMMWANALGNELFTLSSNMTRVNKIEESFRHLNVHYKDGAAMVEDMASDLNYFFNTKVEAIENIMEAAEREAATHNTSNSADQVFQYYNAKEMYEPHEETPTARPFYNNPNLDEYPIRETPFILSKQIVLKRHPNFDNRKVNLNYSMVHVPTNEFDRDMDTIDDIQWSDNLDSTFRANYERDPKLSWQFFCSPTGIMRQYPAEKWNTLRYPIDLFDCRFRSWYFNAASSPANIVILIDNSGSMTGTTQKIANKLVGYILDTLGPNDYVNIMAFTNETKDVVPCFTNRLVQANLQNIREYKEGLTNLSPNKTSGYDDALKIAYDLLMSYQTDKDGGSRCNQAIMVISDLLPENYTLLFDKYNRVNSTMPLRLFTYLIGEDTEVDFVQKLNCSNPGYFVFIKGIEEVKELVLSYVNVMARPIAFRRKDRVITWSHLYADLVDPIMNEYMWKCNEQHEQRERKESERLDREFFYSPDEQNRRYLLRQRMLQEQSTTDEHYKLLITASVPASDLREESKKSGKLLGVAATDIPIDEIKRLMKPFELGVNGYAILLNNNGYVLIHPDLRPFFHGILKPAYSSIDIIEVELLNNDLEPREYAKTLFTDFRDLLLQHKSASKFMEIKYHYDEMKRVNYGRRKYFWTDIENTPFTLIVTYLEDFGLARVQPPNIDILSKPNIIRDLFSNSTIWRIHPHWTYCRDITMSFETPEQQFREFVNRILAAQKRWDWPNLRTEDRLKRHLICNKHLFTTVVWDAKTTQWFSEPRRAMADTAERYGVSLAFLATHSGFTRFYKFSDSAKDDDFIHQNIKSIEETWYKRAVSEHVIGSDNFVYSVPFHYDYEVTTPLVTVSRAIMLNRTVPAAVVGYQFEHSKLFKRFRNITNKCRSSAECRTCDSNDVECYVLDNNGFIIFGKNDVTGKFFGEVRGSIMKLLIADNIYKRFVIYDYQAMCFISTDEKEKKSPASIMRTPFSFVINLMQWVANSFYFCAISLLTSINACPENHKDFHYTDFTKKRPPYFTTTTEAPSVKKKTPQEKVAFDHRVTINKTRPEHCDQARILYKFMPRYNDPIFKTPASGRERPYTILPIPMSNLIFLIIDLNCGKIDPHLIISLEPQVITYNDTTTCRKSTSELMRMRPTSCVNLHYNETLIYECSEGNNMKPILQTLWFSLCVLKIVFNMLA